MKTRKSKLIIIIAAVLLITSLSLFLYPEITRIISKNQAVEVARDFDEIVTDIVEEKNIECEDNNVSGNNVEAADTNKLYDTETNNPYTSDKPIIYKEDIERLYADSTAYNERLENSQYISGDFFLPALDLTEYGIWSEMYGYIEIPSLSLTLPIYLGSSNYNMSIGVTHLMGTSLPIGGLNTNTVISGHTGYIGKTFFDALPSLSIGESVFVTNYWGTLEYKVISEKVISASDANDIFIKKDKDLLTLLTCADAGQKRYQVQCERI